MKKLIAIMALVSTPVLFAQIKVTDAEVKQERKTEAVQVKKEANAGMQEARGTKAFSTEKEEKMREKRKSAKAHKLGDKTHKRGVKVDGKKKRVHKNLSDEELKELKAKKAQNKAQQSAELKKSDD
ncbi:MAG: hypothetical protein WDA08_02365 [Weeksellaceae bacterium]